MYHTTILALYARYPSLRERLENIFPEIVFAASRKLAKVARQSDGKDMAKTQSQFGCAEALNLIALIALGSPIGGELSTLRMYKALLANPSRFVRCYKPTQGVLIISPTGYGSGRIANGHTGIFIDTVNIMSHQSDTDKWTQNYTLGSWKDRYEKVGGFHVELFRVLY
jgi:hypothetical protein